jgi:predicted small integral membrane protein
MIIRLSKIFCITAISFYCLLAAFGNATDYFTNFSNVERALMMKDVFPNSTIIYRAITNPIMHHVAYIIIISLESLTALLCALGAWKLFRARHESASMFNLTKYWAVAGLTLGFLTWYVLFMCVGGEWYGMWMSPVLNGALTAAFHIFISILAVLIYVVAKDE